MRKVLQALVRRLDQVLWPWYVSRIKVWRVLVCQQRCREDIRAGVDFKLGCARRGHPCDYAGVPCVMVDASTTECP